MMSLLILTNIWLLCNSERNERPIIGILAQDLDNIVFDSFENTNYTSYIRACYVKFVESGGARVAPVLLNQPDEYYRMIFRGTNGLLIPGGHADLASSGLDVLLF